MKYPIEMTISRKMFNEEYDRAGDTALHRESDMIWKIFAETDLHIMMTPINANELCQMEEIH